MIVKFGRLMARVFGPYVPPVFPTGNFLLLESGFYFLQEDGLSKIILE